LTFTSETKSYSKGKPKPIGTIEQSKVGGNDVYTVHEETSSIGIVPFA
jgi:hypothetical protein